MAAPVAWVVPLLPHIYLVGEVPSEKDAQKELRNSGLPILDSERTILFGCILHDVRS